MMLKLVRSNDPIKKPKVAIGETFKYQLQPKKVRPLKILKMKMKTKATIAKEATINVKMLTLDLRKTKQVKTQENQIVER